MLSREEYVRISLETNLFFQRIMKEHLFFIETNLQPVVPELIKKTRGLKEDFEALLAETVRYANGAVSEHALKYNEFVTPYTLKAEEVNSKLTGAGINTAITKAELSMTCNQRYNYCNCLNTVGYRNNETLKLLDCVIEFQKDLLSMALECRVFISLYHEMLEHDIREALYYRDILKSLQSGELPENRLCDELAFWNNIMGEHAQFIDGMLDPTEHNLKASAEDFVKMFTILVKESIKASESKILHESLEAVGEIRSYKASAAAGLLKCEIKSIIPPLLADHVLREANYFLRILKMRAR